MQVGKGGLPPLKFHYAQLECDRILSGGKPPFPTCILLALNRFFSSPLPLEFTLSHLSPTS
jgi:hypothetical protein